MRIERAVFYNGRYEGVYSLIQSEEQDKLVWEYVDETFDADNDCVNQHYINSNIILNLAIDRFQLGWNKDGHYCSIYYDIDFKPEDLE